MRSHSVAVNVTTHVLTVRVILVKTNEGRFVVVGMGHGRAGMRVRDVMATVIITTVHGILHVRGYLVIWILILRLIDGAKNVRIMIDIESLEAR